MRAYSYKIFAIGSILRYFFFVATCWFFSSICGAEPSKSPDLHLYFRYNIEKFRKLGLHLQTGEALSEWKKIVQAFEKNQEMDMTSISTFYSYIAEKKPYFPVLGRPFTGASNVGYELEIQIKLPYF